MPSSSSYQVDELVRLREIEANDLAVFFVHEQDAQALHMAAFTAKDPTDPEAFRKHWARVLDDDTMVKRTILVDNQIAGHIIRYPEAGHGEITYWLGREFWGRGIATAALRLFLEQVTERPLFARAAADNLGSFRVLGKCGFVITGEYLGYANARGAEIREFTLVLDRVAPAI